MKKIIKMIVLSILVLMIALMGQTLAASIGINSSSAKVEVDKTVSVTVSFGEKVSAAQFVLQFDSDKFEYVSNSVGNTAYSASTKRFGYMSTTPDLEKITFTFKAKANGDANFSISGAKVSTASEEKVQASITKSTVSIEVNKKEEPKPENTVVNNTVTNTNTVTSNTTNTTKTNTVKTNTTKTNTVKANTTNNVVNTTTNIVNNAIDENVVNEVNTNNVENNQLNTEEQTNNVVWYIVIGAVIVIMAVIIVVIKVKNTH